MMSVTRESWTKRSIWGAPAISLAIRMPLNAAPGQCLCLAQRGAGDPDGAVGQLPLRKRHAFVVLVVRAQAGWPLGKESSHPLEVGFHRVHVEQKCRGGYFGFQQSELFAFCRYPRPMKGILVAMTVMNWTFASSGRLAM